jgi:hypothetical protein
MAFLLGGVRPISLLGITTWPTIITDGFANTTHPLIQACPPRKGEPQTCDPINLDAAWYRQFSGARYLARGGKNSTSPIALILMDGADLKFDTD